MSSTSSSGTQKPTGVRRVGRPPAAPVSHPKPRSLRRCGLSSTETESTSSSIVPKPNAKRKAARDSSSSSSSVVPAPKLRPRRKQGKRPARRRNKRVAKELKTVEEDDQPDDNNVSQDDDDDDDTNSLDGMDPSWTDLVLEAYWKSRAAFERIISAESGVMLKRSFARKRRYRRGSNFDSNPVPDLVIKRDDPRKKAVPVDLEKIEPLPPMIFWTLTEMNIKAEDEYTLSHVPYMGENVDPDALSKELMEYFPDGIHGTQVGCGEYINDFMLYYTVKYSLESIPGVPKEKIYRLIYEQFPNKTQKHALEEIVPDLKARFEHHLIPKKADFDENGFQRANVTPESLLHSYQVLQCYKCTLYDCPHHINTSEDGLIIRRDDRNFKFTPDTCGNNCYLAKRPRKEQPGASPKRNVQLSVETKNANWTPHEESMLALMKAVNITDCCLMSRVLQVEPGSTPKTCVDVYEYFRRQGPVSPSVAVEREPVKKKRNNQIHRKFRAIKWSSDGAVKNRHAYVPCFHEGSCEEENCLCFQKDKICTKYCKCFHRDCKIQFPGCRCNPGNCRTRQCPCYYANWECDPDICRSCRCEPDDNGAVEQQCKNVCFQRGLQKKLSVRPSQVAGWGCFADEPMVRHDFISEYCGEIVSVGESERRGKIYDKNMCSYLFEYQVDATRKGNLIRFANHSSNPNCYAKVVVVNTDHRIGIFATRAIEKGEELFFDYAYSKNHQLIFLNRELDKNRRVVTMTEKDLHNERKRKSKN